MNNQQISLISPRVEDGPKDEMHRASLIRYTGETMYPRYRHGAVLAILPEAYCGQPLRPNAIYAIETRNQGRIFGRYRGLSSGASNQVSPEIEAMLDGGLPGSPAIPRAIIIESENPDYLAMDIPLDELVMVARVLANINAEA